jgi:hypothetical protein
MGLFLRFNLAHSSEFGRVGRDTFRPKRRLLCEANLAIWPTTPPRTGSSYVGCDLIESNSTHEDVDAYFARQQAISEGLQRVRDERSRIVSELIDISNSISPYIKQSLAMGKGREQRLVEAFARAVEALDQRILLQYIGHTCCMIFVESLSTVMYEKLQIAPKLSVVPLVFGLSLGAVGCWDFLDFSKSSFNEWQRLGTGRYHPPIRTLFNLLLARSARDVPDRIEARDIMHRLDAAIATIFTPVRGYPA